MDLGDLEISPATCAALDGMVNDRLGFFRRAIAPYVALARETIERRPGAADGEVAIIGAAQNHVTFGQLRHLVDTFDRFGPLPPFDPEAHAQREAADRARFSGPQRQVNP